jgi:hypothetical protein
MTIELRPLTDADCIAVFERALRNVELPCERTALRDLRLGLERLLPDGVPVADLPPDESIMDADLQRWPGRKVLDKMAAPALDAWFRSGGYKPGQWQKHHDMKALLPRMRRAIKRAIGVLHQIECMKAAKRTEERNSLLALLGEACGYLEGLPIADEINAAIAKATQP